MDRPIIFSAPMVRALLDGRKTQTRRILKLQPHIDESGNFSAPDRAGKVWNWGQNIDGSPCLRNFLKSEVRFAPGDQLYVREAWCRCAETDSKALYRADGEHVVLDDGDGFTATNRDGSERSPWRPSIHMPRWASRLTLVVTDVRVERLQDITNEDCIAEGIPVHPNPNAPRIGPVRDDFARRHGLISYYGGEFRRLWNSINGADAWDANPWVAAVSFTVLRANIDALDIGAAA